MSKKYYLVLDTETLTDARIVFDIAGTIIDRKGRIYEQFNFFPREVVENPLFDTLLKNDSFSKGKANFYIEEIYSNPQNILEVSDITDYFDDVFVSYGDLTIVAYNAAFDIKVLDNLALLFGHNVPFFDVNVPVYDLMHMAMSAICNTKSYVNYAKQGNMVTDRGNIKTNAETVYSFITRDLDFKEAHTALVDTEIEAAILTQVFRTHKALKTTNANPIFNCEAWKQIQKRAKKQ